MTSQALDLSRLPDAVRIKLQSQLDQLPQEIRDKLQAQLSRLPPEQLAQLLQRGSPMLDKLLTRIDRGGGNAGSTSATAGTPAETSTPKPASIGGHYNRTVQAGDKPGSVALIGIGVVLALVVLYATGAFDFLL